jgi:hypothetical protein
LQFFHLRLAPKFAWLWFDVGCNDCFFFSAVMIVDYTEESLCLRKRKTETKTERKIIKGKHNQLTINAVRKISKTEMSH